MKKLLTIIFATIILMSCETAVTPENCNCGYEGWVGVIESDTKWVAGFNDEIVTGSGNRKFQIGYSDRVCFMATKLTEKGFLKVTLGDSTRTVTGNREGILFCTKEFEGKFGLFNIIY